jgi:hypothetical protein
MSKRISFKTCEFCGKRYESKKCDSKYCSPTCRKYAYIERESNIRGWDVTDTYISYKHRTGRELDNRPTESSRNSDVQNLMEKELMKFLKSKGY